MLVGRYDRNAALLDGRIGVEGVDLEIRELDDDRERQALGLSGRFDVWEAFLGRYLLDVDAGRREFSAIPIFVKRTFRHSSIYVLQGGPIASPADLRGRRVGLQHWATTAAIWAKGILAEEHAVPLSAVEWVQTRDDDVSWRRPPWLNLQTVPGTPLLDLLVGGSVDAAITSDPWSPSRDPRIGFLFPDYRERERAYFARTRFFPIMHVLLVRTSTLDRDPWIAQRLTQAWTAAKRECLERRERGRLATIDLWYRGLWEEEQEALGADDPYPWGFAATATEVSHLLAYATEQGILARRYEASEIFHPSSLGT